MIITENLVCMFSSLISFTLPLKKIIYKGLKILKFSYFFPNFMLLLSSILVYLFVPQYIIIV